MIKEMLLAGCGGFAGTCCRYLTGRVCAMFPIGAFPLSTFAVNALGCFLIGLLCGLSERTGILTQGHNLILVTGFCGGFTTFSTFANDIWVLGAKGEITTSVIYTCLSVIAGVALVWLGRWLAS